MEKSLSDTSHVDSHLHGIELQSDEVQGHMLFPVILHSWTVCVCVCVWIWKCIGRLYKEMGVITLARRKDDADQSHAELCDANMLWDLGCCYLWFTSILNAFNSKHLRTTGGALVLVNDRTYSTLQNYTPKAYIWNLYRVHIDLLTTTAAVSPQYKLYLIFTAFLVIKFKHKPQPLFSLDIHLFLQFMWIKNLI